MTMSETISDERLAYFARSPSTALFSSSKIAKIQPQEIAAIATELRALRSSAGAVKALEWEPIESAPAACTLLATYFDEDAGEWIVQLFVVEKPTAPFTHWQIVTSPRGPWLTPAYTPNAEQVTADQDSIRFARQFADMYRSGAQGAEMDCDNAQALALSIDDLLRAALSGAITNGK